MPDIDRRRLLIGLAAASTAATAAAVPALANAPTSAPMEPAELIRLGDALPGIERAYHDATAKRDAAVTEWLPHWPVAPDMLQKPHKDEYSRETNLVGQWVLHEGEHIGRSIWTVSDFDRDIETVTRALRRKRRDLFAPFSAYTCFEGFAMKRHREEWELFLGLLRDHRAVAAAYEAERYRIASASDYAALESAASAALRALKNAVSAIMAQPVAGMMGVLIKSQALAAWGRLPDLYRAFNRDIVAMSLWGPTLAADLTRIAATQAA